MKVPAWLPPFEAILDACEKIKRGQRILIFGGTLLLLGGCFFWFIYMPLSNEIHQSENEIADLKQKVHLAKTRAKKLAEFKEKEAQMDKEFRKALNLLPNKREIPSLLADISQVGVNSRLQFRLFSPGKEELKDFYVEIPVSIEVSGKYRDLALFFDKVRKMERIVNIVNISITPKEELSTNLITKCKAVTYRFKTEADKPKAKPSNKK